MKAHTVTINETEEIQEIFKSEQFNGLFRRAKVIWSKSKQYTHNTCSQMCGETLHAPLVWRSSRPKLIRPSCDWSTDNACHVRSISSSSLESARNQNISLCIFTALHEPSVLWRCWLGGRKGIWPVKTEWWGTGMVICLQQGANDLHMIQLMPLPPNHLLLQ